MDEIFIERLKELINESELSYEKMDTGLGFKSKSTIFKYANGKITKIGPTGIYKLAVFFGVSPSWLAGFSNNKYENLKC